MDASRAQPRFMLLLLGLFSWLALALAAVGLYGVLAYSVAERRQEIGIRLALGAGRSHILQLIMGQGLALTGSGIVVGLIAALALTRLMSSLLYKVGIYDLGTFVLAPLAFLMIALLASYLPAVRAAHVHPGETLRNG
jgi:ABC-type antimicrobial peptide transport system permease subunit